MYRWRRLTPQQRQTLLDVRRRDARPWHSPPHYSRETDLYLITAACYEHQPIIGRSAGRISQFEYELLSATREVARNIFAWNVLPNHYHLLVQAADVKRLLKRLGKLHGRTSYFWNGEEQLRGRKV